MISLEVSFLHGLFLPFFNLETFYQGVSDFTIRHPFLRATPGRNLQIRLNFKGSPHIYRLKETPALSLRQLEAWRCLIGTSKLFASRDVRIG